MNESIKYAMKRAQRFQSPRCLSPRVIRTLFAGALSVLVMARSGTAAAATEDSRTLRVSFESMAIVVEGVTPRGQVVLFGVERRSEMYSTTTVEVSVTIDSDQRGMARHELQRSISPHSIYVAVDSVRGDFVAVSPDGTVLNVPPATGIGMKDKEGLEFDAFEMESHWIQAICVRPGHGAWWLSLMDDSASDENPVGGKVQIGASRMKALGHAEPSPGKFRPRDVLVAIDPYKLTVVARTVGE